MACYSTILFQYSSLYISKRIDTSFWTQGLFNIAANIDKYVASNDEVIDE